MTAFTRPIRRSTVDALALQDPVRYRALLAGYHLLLGDAVADASDALDRAIAGQKPHAYALDDPAFAGAYRAALVEVRAERHRRDAQRNVHDRIAAALLAQSRLRDGVAA